MSGNVNLSYIQKVTANPINALKITILNTKHTKNTHGHFQKSNIFEKQKNNYFYYISKFHNAYFVYLIDFVYFVYLVYFVYFVTATQR